MQTTYRTALKQIADFEDRIATLYSEVNLDISKALSYAIGSEYNGDADYNVIYSVLERNLEHEEKTISILKKITNDSAQEKYNLEICLISSIIRVIGTKKHINQNNLSGSLVNVCEGYAQLFDCIDMINAVKTKIHNKDLKSISSKGGTNRALKYSMMKHEIITILNELRPSGNYKDITHAITTIREKALEFSNRNGINLKESNFDNKLRQWMNEEPSLKKALDLQL